MKKTILILLLLLIALPCYARMNIVTAGGGVPATALNTVNASRGFEADSDPAGWTETDTGSKLNRYATTQAQQETHSMSVTVDADGVQAWQEYNIGEAKTHASVSFWFYASASTAGNFTQLRDIFYFAQSSGVGGVPVVVVYYKKSGTTYTIYISGTSAGTEITVTTGAWYRIEVDATKNTTSYISIFGTDGNQVGTTQSVTANNNNIQYILFGVVTTTDATDRYVLYWDAIGLDWTDGTSPLYPFTVEN